MDGMGFTEREWERLWNGEKNEATATAHFAAFDNEDFCEGCDSDVDYSDGSEYGTCGCA